MTEKPLNRMTNDEIAERISFLGRAIWLSKLGTYTSLAILALCTGAILSRHILHRNPPPSLLAVAWALNLLVILLLFFRHKIAEKCRWIPEADH